MGTGLDSYLFQTQMMQKHYPWQRNRVKLN